MPKVRGRTPDAGFTLVELMVVVAIISIVAILAVQTPEEDDATVDGVAADVSSELDNARLRAMSTHQWQRMTISGQTVTFQVGNTLGMVAPTTWTLHHVMTFPSNVTILSIGATSAIDPTGSAPAAGIGLAAGVTFAADGSSVPRTIYFQDRHGLSPTRLVVFATTGTVLTRMGW